MTDFGNLIDEIDAMPWGPQERAALRDAIAKADERHDLDAAYRLRLRQTTSSFMTGDVETMLSSFPWTIATHDSDPARFPLEVDGHDLLWQYKWMAEVLLCNPNFPLTRVDAVVDDMERRYREAGVGLSGVWQARFTNAYETGRPGEASAFRAKRDELPSDDYSHCDACVRSDDVLYFLECGDDEQALALFDQIIDGGFTCGEEPERVQGHVLMALMRAGRASDAEAQHRRGLRYAEANVDALPLVCLHLPFLAVTGNHAKSLSLIETHMPSWGGDTVDVRTRLGVARSFAVALDAAAAAGHADRLVANSDAPGVGIVLGEHEGLWRVGELAAACWALGESLGAAFDARNGTDRHARLLAAARGLAEVHYDLPLYDSAMGEDAVVVEAASPADAASKAELLLHLLQDSQGALDTALPALTTANADEERRLLGVAWQATAVLERPVAEIEARYVAVVRAAGRDGEADFVQDVSTGLLTDDVDLSRWESHPDPRVSLRVALRQAAGLPELEEVYGRLLGADSVPGMDDLIATARLNLALTDIQGGDRARGIGLLTQVASSECAWMAYLANFRLSGLAADDEDFAAATGFGEAAQGVALRYGVRALVLDASALLADLHWQAGDAPAAIAQQRIALRQAQLSGSPMVGRLQFVLGKRLSEIGQFEGAFDALQASLRGVEEEGLDDHEIAWRQLNLATVAQRFDPSASFAAFREAEARMTDDDHLRSMVCREFGDFLLRYEDEEAVELLGQAVEASRAIEDPIQIAAALHLLGRARSLFGQGGLDELAESRALWEQAGVGWQVADVGDSIGRAHVTLGQVDDGVAALLTAADGYADNDDHYSAVFSELYAARALHEAGRLEEAAALAKGASERAASSGLEGLDALDEEVARLTAE